MTDDPGPIPVLLQRNPLVTGLGLADGYMPPPGSDDYPSLDNPPSPGPPLRDDWSPLFLDAPAEHMEWVVFFARHAVFDGAPGADFINPLHRKAVRELADESQFRVIGTKRREGLRNIALAHV